MGLARIGERELSSFVSCCSAQIKAGGELACSKLFIASNGSCGVVGGGRVDLVFVSTF